MAAEPGAARSFSCDSCTTIDGHHAAGCPRDAATAPRWWPWMRRKTHMAIYVQQGEAYRREIQEAQWARAQAERELQRYVKALGGDVFVERPLGHEEYVIRFTVARRLIEGAASQSLARLVSEHILRSIFDAQRDYRGDMRQTPTQRALGL